MRQFWRRKITPTLSSIYVLRFHTRSKPLTLNNSADQWCNQIIHLEFSLKFSRIDHHELPLQNLIFLTSFVAFLTLIYICLVLSTAVKSFFLKGSALGVYILWKILFFFPRRLRYLSKDWIALSSRARWDNLEKFNKLTACFCLTVVAQNEFKGVKFPTKWDR